MRSSGEVDRAIDLYADTVRRLCMIYLKSYDDTEDIFQNVFIKYLLSSAEFKSPEHEKAWIIRVTINECKDFLKSFFRKRSIPLDEIQELRADAPESSGEVLDAVMSLPQKYKDAVYLHYYEGYSAAEIAKLLRKNVNTIYTNLARARELLRERLGDDFE